MEGPSLGSITLIWEYNDGASPYQIGALAEALCLYRSVRLITDVDDGLEYLCNSLSPESLAELVTAEGDESLQIHLRQDGIWHGNAIGHAIVPSHDNLVPNEESLYAWARRNRGLPMPEPGLMNLLKDDRAELAIARIRQAEFPSDLMRTILRDAAQSQARFDNFVGLLGLPKVPKMELEWANLGAGVRFRPHFGFRPHRLVRNYRAATAALAKVLADDFGDADEWFFEKWRDS